MLNIDSTKKVKSFSTKDYVYEILRENIISLAIEPGQQISEKKFQIYCKSAGRQFGKLLLNWRRKNCWKFTHSAALRLH